MFFKSSSLFIEDLRDVEKQPAHQLVLTEALIFHHWSFTWFEDCPMKNNFKSIPIIKETMSANIVVILVLYRRHNAEVVEAETCADLVVVHFVHSTLSTLFSFLWNGFWWACFWRTSFWWRHLRERFLQMHYASDFFRSASIRCTLSFNLKFLCSLSFIQSEPLINKSFDTGPVHLNKLLADPIDNFNTLLSSKFKWYNCKTPFVPSISNG